MTTTLPPPVAPIANPRRPQRRGWWAAGIVVAIVALFGGISALADNSDAKVRTEVAAASPGLPSSSGDADIDVYAIDIGWAEYGDEVCASYEAVRDVPNIDSYAVEQFEEGYGEKLTSAGRAHLIQLLHAC